MPTVSSARQQLIVRIESKGVDDVFPRGPNTQWRAVRSDPVNVGATGCACARDRKRGNRPRSGSHHDTRGLSARHGSRVLSHRDHHRRIARCSSHPGALFTDTCGIDIAVVIECQRRDLLLRRAVENKPFPGRRNSINQSAAIRPRDQVALGIQCESADVGFITLEEERMISLWRHFVDFATIAGTDVEISGLVESQVPDVLRAGREIFGRGPGRINCGLRRIFRPVVGRLILGLVFGLRGFSLVSGLVLDLVHLAIGGCSCVNYTSWSDLECLHLEFLRLEDDGRLAIGSDAVYTRGRPRGGIDVSRIVGSDGPDVGGGRGVEQFERGRQFQSTGAADGYSGGRTFNQILKLRLLPGARAFGNGWTGNRGDGEGKKEKNKNVTWDPERGV